MIQTFFITLFFSILSIPALARVAPDIRFSAISNLTYQLDCISEYERHCSRKNFAHLWQMQFIKSEGDRRLIADWGEIKKKYYRSIDFEENPDFRITGVRDGIDVPGKLAIGGFQSKDESDYAQRMELILTPADASRILYILNHFSPRFRNWWKRVAEPKGEKFVATSMRLLKSPKIHRYMSDFDKFYGADLATGAKLHFNFFYRPDDIKEPTSGRQIENYSQVEFLAGENPEDRMDVVIHELCHFFFQLGDPKKLSQLTAWFRNQNSLEAQSALNLMNETLATALGNGLIGQLLHKPEKWVNFIKKPQSFYNDHFIDQAAKALMPVLDGWIKSGKTIFDPQFPEVYFGTLTNAMSAELTAPNLILNEMQLVADDAFGGHTSEMVRQSLNVSALSNSEGSWSDERLLQSFKANPDRQTLFLVINQNLPELRNNSILPKKEYDQLAAAVKTSGLALFAYKKTSKVIEFFIVAKDKDEVQRQLDKLAQMKSGFDGLYASP